MNDGDDVEVIDCDLDVAVLSREVVVTSIFGLLFRIRFGLHSELTRLEAVADWAALEAHLCG